MKNILEELWYGNIIPMEHSIGGNAHIKKLINLMGKNREKLTETSSRFAERAACKIR